MREFASADQNESLSSGPITDKLHIRSLSTDDPPQIAAAFKSIGWTKPETQFQRYLSEEAAGKRTCLVATVNGEFAGYITVNWMPSYQAFSDLKIPEIQDLNVLPRFRRKGIATRLLNHAEARVAQRSDVVGIGVGLHPGYNQAQRLYAKRGYIPDGRGLSYRGRYVEEGAEVVLDDELLLHLTKHLSRAPHISESGQRRQCGAAAFPQF